ncbi:YheC/YheD family protein [Paenibacillus sp. MMS18-CY102]|uniref:YheC/YheD family protein n=1 Tax=Paenibacillus sp. MMS18-CY102 TaxID=2682849 RepID=UPI001365242C|nr:YheC/YheD family protein [Paenibacillus sp. MMS18-CY102]MWC28704.1 YheC/YheD family protein [Paenibacillus sp. MMS18-CY102]
MAKRSVRTLLDHNKMRKTKVLLGDPIVRRAIPKTVMLTKARLNSMLKAYKTVYVKPNVGALGIGVMRVRKLKTSRGVRYEWRYKLMTKHATTIAGLYQLIRRHKKSGSYLVQRGIHLLKYRGRRFDLRVMAQRRSPSKPWKVTGILARVAAPGRIVTNGSQGASIHPVMQVFRANMSSGKASSKRYQVENLSRRIARRYAIVHRSCVELGLDVAVDYKWRPWLLETNTKPQITPFRKLKNLSMYYKILSYRRSSRR